MCFVGQLIHHMMTHSVCDDLFPFQDANQALDAAQKLSHPGESVFERRLVERSRDALAATLSQRSIVKSSSLAGISLDPGARRARLVRKAGKLVGLLGHRGPRSGAGCAEPLLHPEEVYFAVDVGAARVMPDTRTGQFWCLFG